jgi:hypothetical protein
MSGLKSAETLHEARTHGTLTARYRLAGLCDDCAPQAGYANQHGGRAVRPPCESCRAFVAGFPIQAANGWRLHTRQTLRDLASSGTERSWVARIPGVALGSTGGASRPLYGGAAA